MTFVFTDVEGSTRVLEELGSQGYADALTEHRRVVRAACAAHGGVEVDTQGDAFFVAFPTAPGALAATAEMTEALAASPIAVRVGVHTGTPFVTEEGYVGIDVHRAARIAAAGHGGQVLVSSATAALVRPGDGQPRGVVLRDLGEHRFKDLEAAERVFQLGEAVFPPLRSLFRSNLPVPATPFLGREQELREVAALIARDEVRLVTLTGPGGTGKTRLALQAAAEAFEHFRDGLWWVSLASIRDPALFPSTIARALGLGEQPGEAIADTLAGHLTGKRVLLLVDNVDHLLPEVAGELARLRDMDGPTVLVTSRERLQLQGEQLWDVPPMRDDDGVALFAARARALDASFAPTPAVHEVCCRLDNLPLAIELAAARVRMFSTEELLERLDQRLDLFKGGHDADPRQQTLRSTIDWSYALLAEDEKLIFRRLSVFSSGCTIEGAEVVCAAAPDTLESLLDKSLLRRRRDPDGKTRYWMLETIREYASEQLASSGELTAWQRAHAEFLALRARALRPTRFTGSFESDLSDWRQATNWALEHRDVAVTIPLIRNAHLWRPSYRERRNYGYVALQLFANMLDPIDEAWLRVGTAHFARITGDRAADAEDARRANQLFRQVGDLGGEAFTAVVLSVEALMDGDHAEAKRLAETSQALARRAGDDNLVAEDYRLLGEIELDQGAFDSAQMQIEQALHMGRNLESVEVITASLHSLGELAIERGNRATARDRYAEGLQEAASARLVGQAALCLAGLAVIAAHDERMQRAGRLWGAAEVLASETGFTMGYNRRRYERRLPLDTDAEFSAAVDEGRALTLEQAVAYALEDPTRSWGCACW